MVTASSFSPANMAEADSPPGRGLWFVMLGIVLILCGVFAMLAPLLSTLATTVIVGLSAAVAGVAQVMQAFRSPAWRGFFLNVLLGLIYLLASAVFLLRPVAGALAIAFTLACLLLATGIGEIALAFRIRPEGGWRWLVFSGLVAIATGVWLMFRLPIAGFFVPGVMLGLALMAEGFAFTAVGAGRKGRQVAGHRQAPLGKDEQETRERGDAG
jgi:uncharacterized membrane protein HdeD (DUF308 family)